MIIAPGYCSTHCAVASFGPPSDGLQHDRRVQYSRLSWREADAPASVGSMLNANPVSHPPTPPGVVLVRLTINVPLDAPSQVGLDHAGSAQKSTTRTDVRAGLRHDFRLLTVAATIPAGAPASTAPRPSPGLTPATECPTR